MPSEPLLAQSIKSLGCTGISTEPRNATPVAVRDVAKPTQSIERWCWIIGISASATASFLLSTLDVAIERRSLALSLTLISSLIAIYLFYGKLRPAPVLSNIGGAIAAVFLSVGAAGIISLVGLRYHYPLIDEALASSDRSLGIDLPHIISWFGKHPGFADLLGYAYDSSFAQLFGLVVLLAVLRRTDKLWELVFVCNLCIVVSTAISVLWPAVGAFAYYDYAADLIRNLPANAGTYHLAKFEYFRNGAAPVLSFASLQGVVTFPSFHCCLALMTILAVSSIRWLLWIVAPWNVLVLASTLPIGGHYVVDLVGGTLLWLTSTVLAVVLGGKPWGDTVARNSLAEHDSRSDIGRASPVDVNVNSQIPAAQE